jgi:putative ABC transport system ATP-binding protein
MTNGGARVVAERVSRAFDGSEVLHDVSFAVDAGELIALTGPSGSGKTTLLQLIGSLDCPTSGRILVDGISVGALRHPAGFRRSTVGFVFQLHYLLPALSAQQNVELPMVVARAQALLDEVGMVGRAGDLPADLSGGERQRVAIARALANQPKLVLADEPTGSLDTVASGRVWQLLSDVRTRRGTTVIVASHDLSLAEHADRSLHLVDGRLIASGAAAPGEATEGVPWPR